MWVFGKASYAKLSRTPDPQVLAAFDHIGYGQGVRYFVGIIEAVAVVLIVLPFHSTLVIGATLLIITMIGTSYAHIKVFRDGDWRFSTILLLLSIILLILRS